MAQQELKIQTESTTGKYKRAVESLKADLLPIGEQFTKVITKIINFGDSVVKMLDKLGPMKNLLGFVLGFVAVAGPLIMLTGVFGNLFGYIMKGISLFRNMRTEGAGLKGITGLLTAENIAASQATQLMSQRMLEDVDATKLLASAIDQLNLKLASMVDLISKTSQGGVGVAMAQAESMAVASTTKIKRSSRLPLKFASGGMVPGNGSGDTYPAMLEPGEAVIPKNQVKKWSPFISAMINDNLPGYSQGNDIVKAHATNPFEVGSTQWNAGVSSAGLEDLARVFPNQIKVVSNLITELPHWLNEALKKGLSISEFQTGKKNKKNDEQLLGYSSLSGKLLGSARAGGADINDPKIIKALNSMEIAIEKRTIELAAGTAEQKVTDGILAQATQEVIAEYMDVKKIGPAGMSAAQSLDKVANEAGQVRIQFKSAEYNAGLADGSLKLLNREIVDATTGASHMKRSIMFGDQEIARLSSTAKIVDGTVVGNVRPASSFTAGLGSSSYVNRQLMSRLIDPIEIEREVLASVENQMTAIQNGIRAGVNKATKSASPSQEGMRIGKNLGEGLVLGASDKSLITQAQTGGKKIGQGAVLGISDKTITSEMRMAGKQQVEAMLLGIKEQTASNLPFMFSTPGPSEPITEPVNNAKGKMSFKGRMGTGMGLMAASMAVNAMGSSLPAPVQGYASAATTGGMIGSFIPVPGGTIIGAGVGLAIKGIADLMKIEKEHKAMAEATFSASSEAVSMFGAKVQDTSQHLWSIHDSTSQTLPALAGFNKQLNDFNAMVSKLPANNPLSLVLKNMKESKDSGAAKQIAESFTNTQIAINGLDPKKAKDLFNLLSAASGNDSLIGTGKTATDRAEAISKTITKLNKDMPTIATLVSAGQGGRASSNLAFSKNLNEMMSKSILLNKELVQRYKDLINIAGNTKSYDEFKAIQDGITSSNLTQSQSFMLLEAAIPNAKKKLEEYMQAGLDAAQALAMLQAESMGLTGALSAESKYGAPGALYKPGTGDAARARNAQAAVKAEFERIAKAAADAAKPPPTPDSSGTGLSPLEALIAQLEETKQAYQDQKDALDKSIQAQKDYNDQLQKTQDYLTATTDLENQIRTARAKGDYLQVSLLKQQLAGKRTEFTSAATLTPAEQQSKKLADAIDALTKEIADANKAAKDAKNKGTGTGGVTGTSGSTSTGTGGVTGTSGSTSTGTGGSTGTSASPSTSTATPKTSGYPGYIPTKITRTGGYPIKVSNIIPVPGGSTPVSSNKNYQNIPAPKMDGNNPESNAYTPEDPDANGVYDRVAYKKSMGAWVKTNGNASSGSDYVHYNEWKKETEKLNPKKSSNYYIPSNQSTWAGYGAGSAPFGPHPFVKTTPVDEIIQNILHPKTFEVTGGMARPGMNLSTSPGGRGRGAFHPILSPGARGKSNSSIMARPGGFIESVAGGMARPGGFIDPTQAMARPGMYLPTSPGQRVKGAEPFPFAPSLAMPFTGYSGTPSWYNQQLLTDAARKKQYEKSFEIPHGGYSGAPAPVNVTTNSPTYNININGADINNKDAHDHLVKKVLGALKQADAKNNTLRRI
jgi:hypothetical protein